MCIDVLARSNHAMDINIWIQIIYFYPQVRLGRNGTLRTVHILDKTLDFLKQELVSWMDFYAQNKPTCTWTYIVTPIYSIDSEPSLIQYNYVLWTLNWSFWWDSFFSKVRCHILFCAQELVGQSVFRRSPPYHYMAKVKLLVLKLCTCKLSAQCAQNASFTERYQTGTPFRIERIVKFQVKG